MLIATDGINPETRTEIEGRAGPGKIPEHEHEASMTTTLNAIAAALLAGALATLPAAAQQRVDAKKDWSIFEAGSGATKQCWIVSQPTGWKATRGGQTVQVNRGDIFLMVAVRPADKVTNEVSFLGGYPFQKGSQVTVEIGSKTYKLFTDNESAWAPSTNEDNQIVAAMRAGAKAIVKGESSRGSTTHDTFSLSGFTAALKAAQDRCK